MWIISSLSFQPDWSWENIFHNLTPLIQDSTANLLNKENAFIPVTVAVIWRLPLQVLHVQKAARRVSPGSDLESAAPEMEPEISQERQPSLSQVRPWVRSTGTCSSLHGRLLGIKHWSQPLEGVKIPHTASAWSTRECLIQGAVLLFTIIPWSQYKILQWSHLKEDQAIKLRLAGFKNHYSRS